MPKSLNKAHGESTCKIHCDYVCYRANKITLIAETELCHEMTFPSAMFSIVPFDGLAQVKLKIVQPILEISKWLDTFQKDVKHNLRDLSNTNIHDQ